MQVQSLNDPKIQPDHQYGPEMVDAELNVISLPKENIPQWIRSWFQADARYDDISQLTFFYHPETDAVVLNRSHTNADFYELLVTTYLGTVDSRRQELKQTVPAEIIGTAVELLDFILEERSRRCRTLNTIS